MAEPELACGFAMAGPVEHAATTIRPSPNAADNAVFRIPTDLLLYTLRLPRLDAHARTDEFHGVMLKSGRGEHTAEIGASIDPDAAAIEMGFCRWGVTMNDHSLEELSVVQKFLAYPEKVLFRLLVQRNAGADAGVYKEVIAYPYA